jgi:hypothetical protein
VVTSKRAEADATHDRIEQRSTLLKNLLMLPLNMGIPLIRSLLAGNKDRGD